MDQAKAQRILQAGRDRGADFVEIFEEETRHAGVSFKDRKVESASAGTDYGLGLRLLFGSEVLYAHTSKDDEDHLIRLIEALTLGRGGNVGANDYLPLQAPQQGTPPRPFPHIIALDPRKVGQENKLDLLRRADEAARRF